MAQNINPKGSIVYKTLIVILAVALIATILYPKKLWREEAEKTKQCRSNMEHILYAELLYIGEHQTYTDSLDSLVRFIKADTTGKRLEMFANIDSTLSSSIMNYLKSDTLAEVIIDSLLRYGHKYDIDTTEAMVLDSLRTYPKFAKIIDSLALYSLDHLFECPTVHKPYQITVIDTSAIKHLIIQCPIDSLDSLAVARDFKLSKLGGLVITNHGKIEDGERSWAK